MNLRIVIAVVFALFCVKGFAQQLPLPPRPATGWSSADFIARIAKLPLAEREEEITAQVLAGNVPDFLRRLQPVTVKHLAHTATFFVAPDYLAVGTDSDYFLTPLTPISAQRIAERLGCTLPTRKMTDDIYLAAQVKLEPQNFPPNPAMTSVAVFSDHNNLLRAQRLAQRADQPFGKLTAGGKKDVVISATLPSAPGKVAIYGLQRLDGTPIQPLFTGHAQTWVDYSHGIRLVQQEMKVDGAPRKVADVLADAELAPLLSDEGVIVSPRYDDSGSAPERTPGPFGEYSFTFTHESGVRILINTPAHRESVASQAIELVVYALPNGSTIEQTIGKKTGSGVAEKFDLQHIGAQMRFVREKVPTRRFVIAYVESRQLSWPDWRKANADSLIPGIIAAVRAKAGEGEMRITLCGHSGGGSFIFGYINAVAAIPEDITRIAFLDATYGYEPALGHGDKLAAWLSTPKRDHRLCVLAYHDDIALLNGKPFVSATSGTWYRSHLMQTDLEKHFTFMTTKAGDIMNIAALEGRIRFLLHKNPDRAILHTVQVEKNGFIQSLLSGTPDESRGYRYFGPRDYTKWIAE